MHRGTEIEGDIGTDANQSGVSPSIELDGFVPFEIPLAAVIARLRGRTLVKVLRVDDLEETKTTHPR